MHDLHPVLAVLFGCDASLIADSVHALAVDALAAGCRVVGVPVDDALGGTTPLPVLMLDSDGDLTTAALCRLPAVAAAMVTALGPGECRAHAELAEHLLWPLVNPPAGARRADDKALCHALLEAASVPTPRSRLLRRGVAEDDVALQVVAALGRGPVYVLPNAGTEGRGVERFEANEAGHAVAHAASVLRYDECLIREERGMVRYTADDAGGDLRALVLRVHVAWDGDRFVAESGFAQVAGAATVHVAGRARECAIVPIGVALQRLWVSQPMEAPVDDIAALRDVCVRAAAALAEGLPEEETLKLVGLDLVLETDEHGRLRPIVLEANARPAGLNHSAWLPGSRFEPTGLGVTRALWSWLGATRSP